MGEEEDECSIPETGLTEEPTWIVDPIDGTTNFVHCFRFTVISIALAVGREAVVGVVYNPVTEELFEAVKGEGAWLNDRRLVNRCALDLESSLVFTEFGATGRGCNVTRRMEQLERLVAHGVHGIRMLGSAAYNMCVIANGAGQLYFEEGIHAWDIAAGVVILAEAGGIVANFGLNDSVCFDLTARSVVAASSQQIYSEFTKLMQ
jgi:myo-inositol-1(or 4)-monophosphatase